MRYSPGEMFFEGFRQGWEKEDDRIYAAKNRRQAMREQQELAEHTRKKTLYSQQKSAATHRLKEIKRLYGVDNRTAARFMQNRSGERIDQLIKEGQKYHDQGRSGMGPELMQKIVSRPVNSEGVPIGEIDMDAAVNALTKDYHVGEFRFSGEKITPAAQFLKQTVESA